MNCRNLGVALAIALLSSHVHAATSNDESANKKPSRAAAKTTDQNVKQAAYQSRSSTKKKAATRPAPAKLPSRRVRTASRHTDRGTTFSSNSSGSRSTPKGRPRQASPRVARTPERPVESIHYEESWDEAALDSYPDEVFYEGSLDDYSCDSCGDVCLGNRCYRQRTWVRNEYILWWSKSSVFPPLLTTADIGTAQNVAGIVGQPSTTILFGDDRTDFDGRSGGRLTLGYWMDNCHVIGIEGNFFGVGDGSVTLDVDSGGDPILARPFENLNLASQAAQLIAFPGISTGSVRVESSSEVLGAEANIRHLFSRSCDRRIDLLMGYRFARLDDGLRISDSLTSIDTGGTVPLGTVITGFDDFSTTNEFHGGQLGLIAEVRHCRWTLSLVGKLGLGNMHQSVHIDGATSVTVPTGVRSFTDGGLLAQPTNMGDFERDRFAIIPELGVNFRYDMSKCLRLTAGYTFIYFNRVVRPDDQIDLGINTTQITGNLTGVARPTTTFTETDYWLQGLSFGFEYWF